MTRITIREDGDVHSIEATGHATGSTDVCAAISALIESLAIYAEKFAEKMITEVIEDGNVRLAFKGARAGFVFTTMGLEAIAESYPDYLVVLINK